MTAFSFRFLKEKTHGRASLAIFLTSEPSADQIVKIIKNDVERNLVPQSVTILAPSETEISCDTFLNNESFRNEFLSFVGDDGKLTVILVTPDGEFIEAKSRQNAAREHKRLLLQTGMLEIFMRRRGVVTTSSDYHFVKPSGDHCDGFIRASNLLVSGVEVAFLGIALISHLKPGLRRIYVDTSSISYLISTAIAWSKRFTREQPHIESFESYAALKQKYDFVEDSSSLIIISATTSGSLAKSILSSSSFRSNQVITLFYSQLPSDQHGIFDILPALTRSIASVNAENCQLCKAGSKRINIVGDQFLPETPQHESLMIRKVDFSSSRANFIDEFATKGVLRWNDSSDTLSETREHFYLDVGKALEVAPVAFKELLTKKVKKHFSADTRLVVTLDDLGSAALASAIRSVVSNEEHILWTTLASLKDEEISNGSSVVVIAGAITSGRKLLQASRRLRKLPRDASIVYIVGFSKLPTAESLSQLEKDLKQGDHEFVVIRKVPLPRLGANVQSSWDLERSWMEKFDADDPLADVDVVLPAPLVQRLSVLRGPANDCNSLFCNAPSGLPLKLRPSFAFWSDLKLNTEEATQSDVYWTIQTVLHDLRVLNKDKGLASVYHTTLISPACFDRYNDGVIQACLLRAAHTSELNYAIDEDLSAKMSDVIQSVLSDWQSEQGEASLEFLLALATQKVKLCRADLRKIASIDTSKMPEAMQFMIGQIGLNK
ncbi:hypothetical protein ACN9MU_01395 [Pseudoduganella sp. R-32]|uniref:hypothetical protein n=1 Tax=Pseudoduganella sp. R-32 TaxID=3404061 RepID=UPI003CEE5724